MILRRKKKVSQFIVTKKVSIDFLTLYFTRTPTMLM